MHILTPSEPQIPAKKGQEGGCIAYYQVHKRHCKNDCTCMLKRFDC